MFLSDPVAKANKEKQTIKQIYFCLYCNKCFLTAVCSLHPKNIFSIYLLFTIYICTSLYRYRYTHIYLYLHIKYHTSFLCSFFSCAISILKFLTEHV